ncbi:hypothetical protein [Streptomyces aurantiacus]|uniref:hypothetical protein n=1 Tax=Streptomyces aurantiacus TaxID=47760 RepID=UPI0027D78222|nr:hypothetical protein [Streptomyces aurantiacus]
MPATLVIRVHEQVRQLIDSAADAGDMAGDSRGDPMAVLRQALPEHPRDDLSLSAESAVAPCGIAAGEIAEKDEISGGPREHREPQR